MNTSDFKSFHYLESGEVTFSVLSTVKSVNKLDSGSYKIDYAGYPRETVTLHKNKDMESSKVPTFFEEKDVIDEYIDKFCTEEVRNTLWDLGFYHKGGVLLYGVEGAGKTSIVKHYCTELINNYSAIVLHIDNSSYLDKIWDFVIKVRQIQDNLIIVVFDEIDRYFRGGEGGREALLKSLIDGSRSIHNCLFFAMTNYIDDIPQAIKDRPSRFKYCIEVRGIDDIKCIFTITKHILGNLLEDDALLIFSTKLIGSTLDVIKQACLDEIMELRSKQESNKHIIGFRL